LKVAKEAGG